MLELRFWFRCLQPALLALPLVTGCAAPSAEQSDPAVRATLVGERPGPPPLTRLLVDLQVRNDAAVPRWALIPSNLPARTDAGGGVVHLEQRTAAAAAGPIAVGRLLGRAGTYALALAPGAQVTLRRLEIGWWREPPWAAGAALEILLAGTVTVNGQPLATWFDGDPLIRGRVEVDMSAAVHTHSHRAIDGREVPLAAKDVTPLAVRLAPP